MTTPLTDAQILDADAETAELLSAQAQAHALLADAGRVPGLIAELAAAHKLLGEWRERVARAEESFDALIEEAVLWQHSEICGGQCNCDAYKEELTAKYRTLKETHHG